MQVKKDVGLISIIEKIREFIIIGGKIVDVEYLKHFHRDKSVNEKAIVFWQIFIFIGCGGKLFHQHLARSSFEKRFQCEK